MSFLDHSIGKSTWTVASKNLLGASANRHESQELEVRLTYVEALSQR